MHPQKKALRSRQTIPPPSSARGPRTLIFSKPPISAGRSRTPAQRAAPCTLRSSKTPDACCCAICLLKKGTDSPPARLKAAFFESCNKVRPRPLPFASFSPLKRASLTRVGVACVACSVESFSENLKGKTVRSESLKALMGKALLKVNMRKSLSLLPLVFVPFQSLPNLHRLLSLLPCKDLFQQAAPSEGASFASARLALAFEDLPTASAEFTPDCGSRVWKVGVVLLRRSDFLTTPTGMQRRLEERLRRHLESQWLTRRKFQQRTQELEDCQELCTKLALLETPAPEETLSVLQPHAALRILFLQRVMEWSLAFASAESVRSRRFSPNLSCLAFCIAPSQGNQMALCRDSLRWRR